MRSTHAFRCPCIFYFLRCFEPVKRTTYVVIRRLFCKSTAVARKAEFGWMDCDIIWTADLHVFSSLRERCINFGKADFKNVVIKICVDERAINIHITLLVTYISFIRFLLSFPPLHLH